MGREGSGGVMARPHLVEQARPKPSDLGVDCKLRVGRGDGGAASEEPQKWDILPTPEERKRKHLVAKLVAGCG